MMHAMISLLMSLSLAGCGVILPYMYDAGKLEDRLMISMSREQVRKILGKPDRVVQNDGRQAVWEYRLFAKGEWRGYLIHCPLHPFCYFPAEPPVPYYLASDDDQLCVWAPGSCADVTLEHLWHRQDIARTSQPWTDRA